MIGPTPGNNKNMRRRMALILTGPPALAFLPALSLFAFWFGGEKALLVVSACLPILFLLTGNFSDLQAPVTYRPSRFEPGLLSRADIETRCAQVFEHARANSLNSAAFFLEVEDFANLTERYGQHAADQVIQRIAERLKATLRSEDSLGQMGDARFAICIGAVQRLDLELCIQLAGRLQNALEDPMTVDGTSIYVTSSVGFCELGNSPADTGFAWLQAAATALRAAQRRGPSTIRAFTNQMRLEAEARSSLRDEVALALDSGQIQPWFQPQISTDTGQITGFEALARWQHPTRGMITPGEFLPVIEEDGLLERLAEVMLYHAFSALKAWDGSGLHVPQVGVNFTGTELGNPKLVDKIKWELDRFDLAPERLAVEVLETVLTLAPDDTITQNIRALADLGCKIDLDDFGTGHASIASIKRFSVGRIKIDRSFVMKADRDPEQQRMISAILTMAERLQVETLGEGVESLGEHELLAQLGCNHVQGFGIARPMTFEHSLEWIPMHNAKLSEMPQILTRKQS